MEAQPLRVTTVRGGANLNFSDKERHARPARMTPERESAFAPLSHAQNGQNRRNNGARDRIQTRSPDRVWIRC